MGFESIHFILFFFENFKSHLSHLLDDEGGVFDDDAYVRRRGKKNVKST